MNHLAHHRRPHRRQRGAMLITAALVMFLLLGFIGSAMDFGRLFVIKTELQTAMDSCALAAAQELDAQADALTRAQSAGKSAADLNRVDFQSANWAGLGMLQTAQIVFRDSNYNVTTTPGAAVYAECQHTHTGAPTWLMQSLGAFGGNASLGVNTRNVFASAVATKGSAQSTCPVPMAIRPKVTGCHEGNCGAPNYGYAPGEWVTMLTKNDTGAPGYVGWANLNGSNSANDTVAQMNGYCGVIVTTPLGTPGTQSNVVRPWNWRFGIYSGGSSPTSQFAQPDRTGYIYTSQTWPPRTGETESRHAYDGTTPTTAPAGAANFLAKRQQYANCIDSTSVTNTGGPGSSAGQCSTFTGITLPPSDLLPGGTGTNVGHHGYGTNRRIVLVPVTNGYPGSVQDFACMLMLQPLTPGLNVNVQLEYIGNAAAVGSPCTTSGMPGGTAGPLVPVLVR